MAEFSIQEKINSYVSHHQELKGKSEDVILSCMLKDNAITQKEIDNAKATSAFGFGFNSVRDIGLTVESTTSDIEVPYAMTKEEREVAEKERVAYKKKLLR